jgi:hypothetical protein
MDPSSGKKDSAQAAPPVQKSEGAEAMESAVDSAIRSAATSPDTNLTPGSDEALNGPVVLGQPTASTSAPADVVELPGASSANGTDSSALTLRVVAKGKLTTVKDAVAKKYRTASETTDGFVRDSPWQSVAFAVLGGVIVGMLAAR